MKVKFHCTGRYELKKLAWLSICGFPAQLVEHRIGLAEVTSSIPVEALIIFRFLEFTVMIILHFHSTI